MRVNENGQYVSDDGFWVWDGAAWIPADGSAAPATADAASTETTSSSTVSTETPAAQADAPAVETVHEPEATQEYAAVDYASDTTVSGGFGYEQPAHDHDHGAHDHGDHDHGDHDQHDHAADDAGGLREADRVVPHVDNAHPMSPDGRHWWDGEQWIDVSTDATTLHAAALSQDAEPASAAAQSSFDSGWQGTDQEVAAPAEPESVLPGDPEPAQYEQPVQATEPVQAAQAAQAAQAVQAADSGRQLSPDGMWEWNGTQWVPASAAAAPVRAEPEPEPEPVKPVQAERQLSPDGRWEWDGTAWVPAQQAAATVPPGAHISPDGHWWWDGSQWLPTGN